MDVRVMDRIVPCEACGNSVHVRRLGERYRIQGLFCYNLPGFLCGDECLDTLPAGRIAAHTLPEVTEFIDEVQVIERIKQQLTNPAHVDASLNLLESLVRMDGHNLKFVQMLCILLAGSARVVPEPNRKRMLINRLHLYLKVLEKISPEQATEISKLIPTSA